MALAANDAIGAPTGWAKLRCQSAPLRRAMKLLYRAGADIIIHCYLMFAKLSDKNKRRRRKTNSPLPKEDEANTHNGASNQQDLDRDNQAPVYLAADTFEAPERE